MRKSYRRFLGDIFYREISSSAAVYKIRGATTRFAGLYRRRAGKPCFDSKKKKKTINTLPPKRGKKTVSEPLLLSHGYASDDGAWWGAVDGGGKKTNICFLL